MELLTTIVITLHVLVALAIIGLVLLQHGKGADMGSGFGGGMIDYFAMLNEREGGINGDGAVDCADTDCTAEPACCMGVAEVCNNMRDDDCDRLVDCADPDCVDQARLLEDRPFEQRVDRRTCAPRRRDRRRRSVCPVLDQSGRRGAAVRPRRRAP